MKFKKLGLIAIIFSGLLLSSCSQQNTGTISTTEPVAEVSDVLETVQSKIPEVAPYTDVELAAFDTGDIATIIKSEHCRQFITESLKYFSNKALGLSVYDCIHTDTEAASFYPYLPFTMDYSDDNNYGQIDVFVLNFLFSNGKKTFKADMYFDASIESVCGQPVVGFSIPDDVSLSFYEARINDSMTHRSGVSLNGKFFNYDIDTSSCDGFDLSNLKVAYYTEFIDDSFDNVLKCYGQFLNKPPYSAVGNTPGITIPGNSEFCARVNLGSFNQSVKLYVEPSQYKNYAFGVKTSDLEPVFVDKNGESDYWKWKDACESYALSDFSLTFISDKGEEFTPDGTDYIESTQAPLIFVVDFTHLRKYMLYDRFKVPASFNVVDIELRYKGEPQFRLGTECVEAMSYNCNSQFFDEVASHPTALNSCVDTELKELVRHNYESAYPEMDWHLLQDWCYYPAYAIADMPNYDSLADIDTFQPSSMPAQDVLDKCNAAVADKLRSQNYTLVTHNNDDNCYSLCLKFDGITAKFMDEGYASLNYDKCGSMAIETIYADSNIISIIGNPDSTPADSLAALCSAAFVRADVKTVGNIAAMENEDYYFIDTHSATTMIVRKSDYLPVWVGNCTFDWDDVAKLQYHLDDSSVTFTQTDIAKSMAAVMRSLMK